MRSYSDRAIAVYYPDIPDDEDKYVQFYDRLVTKVAQLAAQWMTAGFCHGVLNTDNMSITGESFDYGPYAFIPTYDARFTAAYFDYGGRYSYGNQPDICKFNLELLQKPLSLVAELSSLETALIQFDDAYQQCYQQLMLQRLGFDSTIGAIAGELFSQTIELLRDSEISYQGFFRELTEEFDRHWKQDPKSILTNATFAAQISDRWRTTYHSCLNCLSDDEMKEVKNCLNAHNPKTALLRPVIESVWQAIANDNNWQPFESLVSQLQA